MLALTAVAGHYYACANRTRVSYFGRPKNRVLDNRGSSI